MKYPAELIEAVEAVAIKHTSTSAAITAAQEAVKNLPTYGELVECLVAGAVQQLVYDCRHSQTVQAKREAGQYGTGAKVIVGDSEAVADASRSFFDSWSIGGTCIGDLTLEELPGLEEQERQQSASHLVNAEVLAWLRPKMKNGRKVRDCVTETALKKKFAEIKRQFASASAA